MVDLIKFMIVLSIIDENRYLNELIAYKNELIKDKKYDKSDLNDISHWMNCLNENRYIIEDIYDGGIEPINLIEMMWPKVKNFLKDNPEYINLSLSIMVNNSSIINNVILSRWVKILYRIQTRRMNSLNICEGDTYPVYGIITKLLGKIPKGNQILADIFKDIVTDELYDSNHIVANNLFWTELPNPFAIKMPQLVDYNDKVILHEKTNYCVTCSGNDALLILLVNANNAISNLEKQYFINLFKTVILNKDLSILECYREKGSGRGRYFGLIKYIFSTELKNIDNDLESLRRALLKTKEVRRQINILKYYIPELRGNIELYIKEIEKRSTDLNKKDDINQLRKLLW